MRLALVADHYRSDRDWTEEHLPAANDRLARWRTAVDAAAGPPADTLLADVEHEVAEKYGAWKKKSMYGKSFMGLVRTTFLIGPDGVVTRRWDNVKVDGHAEAVLEAVEAL